MMGNMLMYDAQMGNMLMYDAQIEQNTTVDDLQ